MGGRDNYDINDHELVDDHGAVLSSLLPLSSSLGPRAGLFDIYDINGVDDPRTVLSTLCNTLSSQGPGPVCLTHLTTFNVIDP